MSTPDLLQVVAMREREAVQRHLESQSLPSSQDIGSEVEDEKRQEEQPVVTREESPVLTDQADR